MANGNGRIHGVGRVRRGTAMKRLIGFYILSIGVFAHAAHEWRTPTGQIRGRPIDEVSSHLDLKSLKSQWGQLYEEASTISADGRNENESAKRFIALAEKIGKVVKQLQSQRLTNGRAGSMEYEVWRWFVKTTQAASKRFWNCGERELAWHWYYTADQIMGDLGLYGSRPDLDGDSYSEWRVQVAELRAWGLQMLGIDAETMKGDGGSFGTPPLGLGSDLEMVRKRRASVTRLVLVNEFVENSVCSERIISITDKNNKGSMGQSILFRGEPTVYKPDGVNDGLNWNLITDPFAKKWPRDDRVADLDSAGLKVKIYQRQKELGNIVEYLRDRGYGVKVEDDVWLHDKPIPNFPLKEGDSETYKNIFVLEGNQMWNCIHACFGKNGLVVVVDEKRKHAYIKKNQPL